MRLTGHSGLGRCGSVLVAGRHLDDLGGLPLCYVPYLRLCFCLGRVRAVCCLALSSGFHQLRDLTAAEICPHGDPQNKNMWLCFRRQNLRLYSPRPPVRGGGVGWGGGMEPPAESRMLPQGPIKTGCLHGVHQNRVKFIVCDDPRWPALSGQIRCVRFYICYSRPDVASSTLSGGALWHQTCEIDFAARDGREKTACTCTVVGRCDYSPSLRRGRGWWWCHFERHPRSAM